MALFLRTRADVEKVPAFDSPPVLLYAFSKFGWGHAMRCLKIAKALHRLDVPSLIVCSQGELPALHVGSSVVALVPHFDYVGTTFPIDIPRENLESSIGSLSVNELVNLRSQLVTDLIERVRPRAFYADAFPFNPEVAVAECEQALRQAKAFRIPTASGFRGAFSKPPGPQASELIRDLLAEYIDNLFLFVDPREQETLQKECPFLLEAGCQVTYCGYATWNSTLSVRPGMRRGVVGTFGAGIDAFDAARTLLLSFREYRNLWPPEADHLTLAAGSRLPRAAFDALAAISSQDDAVTLTHTLAEPQSVYEASHMAVTMAGYNTCVDLLEAECPAIALPRCSERNREQVVNAEKFRAYGVFHDVLLPDKRNPKTLALAAGRLTRTRPANRPEIGGAERAARVLAGIEHEYGRQRL